MQSHAQLPTADHVKGSIYRIYFASRDSFSRSHVGYIEIDLNEPHQILTISKTPILEPGPAGFFDEHGVYPSSIVTLEDSKYLYYVGWSKGSEYPLFYASIGLAQSLDGGCTFRKCSQAPIMERSEYDPCLVTSPCVFIESGLWRMYYVSGIRWERFSGTLISYYHIKYAESTDGVNWIRQGRVAIDFKSERESNIARPSIIKADSMFEMWYSYVEAKPYRIGYAKSKDGIVWQRKDDEAGIDVSNNGFDSEMVCYPFVIVQEGKRYILYNGNAFGREGIGLAVYNG